MKRLSLLLALSLVALPVLNAQESAADLAQERGLNPGTADGEASAADLAGDRGLNPGTKDSEESAAQLAAEQGGAIGTKDNETSAADLAGERNLNPGTADTEQSAGELANERLGMDPTPTPTPATSSEGANSVFSNSQGVNGTIYAAVVQPDGKVVIGGEFNEVGFTPRMNLARLNADGSLDNSFLSNPTDGVNGTVYALAIDAKGGILVGGMFNQAQAVEQRNFVRYLPTGRLDTQFGTPLSGPNGKVLAIAVQPSGDIVVGGEFSNVNNQLRRNIAQIKADGSLADTLTSGVSGTVASLVTLPDGNVLVGGGFQVEDGPRNILRMPASGR